MLLAVHRKITVILMALNLCLLSVISNISTVHGENGFKGNVIRIAGNNRYRTAIEVSEAVRDIKQADKMDCFIVCSGDNFPDALAGSYLSAQQSAPIIPINEKNADTVIDYIRNNITADGTIYILGGIKAVSASIERELRKLTEGTVFRAQGKDRYETNRMILMLCEDLGKEILICTGKDYADSLSASSCNLPVLMVNGSSLSEQQKQFLHESNFERLTILGGEKAVSSSLEEQLKEYGEVSRIGGSNREETSYLIAKRYFPSSQYAVVAYSRNFPDGLCGGLLGHMYQAPVLLVSDSRYSYASKYVSEKGILNGRVLGGKNAISDETVCRIFGCASSDIRIPGEQDRHVITYVLNDGINDPGNPESYLEGEHILLKPAEKDYRVFAGWYLDKALTKRIEAITPDVSGDITLYAKWNLAPLNENQQGNDNMIWSWWCYPQVLVDDENAIKVFWGFTDNEGFSGIAEYDDETAKVTKTILKKSPEIDDHDSVALEFMDDGRILVAYSAGHNNGKEVHVRISDLAKNIEKFSTDIILESSGAVCYSQILKTENGYFLFYRYNNQSWAYRYSTDGIKWSGEVIIVTAPEQYYCKFVPVLNSSLIRIVMYSNPNRDRNEIRTGFLDAAERKLLKADGNTVLGDRKISFDQFDVVIQPESGRKQRLFDVAVTAKDELRFLFASFNPKAANCDSIYCLYDTSEIKEICNGGNDLYTNKYQLGASFCGDKNIVAARNQDGKDIIELYEIKDDKVEIVKTLYQETKGVENIRNARPITDRQGKVVLWHRGMYDSSSFKKFSTSACLYFVDDGCLLMDDSFPGIEKAVRRQTYEQVDPEVLEKADSYLDKVYEDNRKDDYTTGQFTWYYDNSRNSWIYTTGLVIQGFLEKDFDQYCPEIIRFYDQHIRDDGSIIKYINGELDSVITATGIIDLINSGILSEEKTERYKKAVSYVYHELEQQTIYPTAGNMWQHSERNGVPTKGWVRWNFCLDGVFMSQMFICRLAQSIEKGTIVITDLNGETVTAEKLWNDVFTRMSFVMDNMMSDSGVLYHGYCVAERVCNGVCWGRGNGWFAMALLEAALNCPEQYQERMQDYYRELMDGVVRWQDEETFLWYNVMDHREEVTDNIPESSCSSMFSYCLLKGYQKGILNDEKYYLSGMRGFNAMIKDRIVDGNLMDTMSSSGVTSDINRYAVNGYVENEAKSIGGLLLAFNYVY